MYKKPRVNNYISCPICHNDKYRPIFKKSITKKYNVSIVQCEHCEFVLSKSAALGQEVKQDFVFENYWRSKKIGNHIDKRFIRHFTRRARSHLKLISGFYPKGFTGRALDIGCGAGLFLDEIRKQGWSVHGIEPDKECYDYAINTLKLDVDRCLFADYQTEEKVDLLYFSHVFDDINNIDLVCRKIKSLLSSEGRVFIEVPNLISYGGFENINDEDLIVNKYYFTTSTLRNLLEENGFTFEYFKSKEPIYLNTVGQVVLSPFKVYKKMKSSKKKSLIRVIAS
ncbi:class I SAM-dependent methyltransferase [Candidatus Marinimicrobia bacterium MT.SAG.3]|nr:class I SAM-dependent methyltransferase [Candidatus Marinimicrobia bacterium MT.SAG.3]